jgi:formylglycine-generating enzyme required for sulfatase activity
VDWCDAHAYCHWAGKRLCGALAGGELALGANPVLGEWHYACTGGLQTVYPYGNDPVEGACNIPGNADRQRVATHPGCEGGFDGIFDIIGNVSEWIDACADGSASADCQTMGGHTYGTATYWRCNQDAEVESRNTNTRREVGIRCCRDAE